MDKSIVRICRAGDQFPSIHMLASKHFLSYVYFVLMKGLAENGERIPLVQPKQRTF
jgi:hypothetical protein